MLITSFTHLRPAQAFVDYMAMRGIRLRIEHQDNSYRLWLDDESKHDEVESELNQYLRDPNHPRYQAASWHSGTTDSVIRYSQTSLMTTLRQRSGPLTLVVAVACLVVFVLMQLFGDLSVMRLLAWPDSEQHFQLWRWFSPGLLHFSLLHILFNLVWWWYLGGMIEKRLGSGKLLVITLISALLSGWVQAKFSGVMFGGLSGVVYALMGYSWLYGQRHPQSGVFLQPGLMAFSVLWLLVGWFGWFGLSIANGAHVTGLLVGLAMAFVDSRKK